METKEKMDTDSIVAKPEYAASEYSTEAPPVSFYFFMFIIFVWQVSKSSS